MVDTDTGEVVNVTWLGKANHRVNQDVGLTGASSADSELSVSTVHGVSGLEGHNLGPAQLVEVQAEFCRSVWLLLVKFAESVRTVRTSKTDIVVVLQPVNGF